MEETAEDRIERCGEAATGTAAVTTAHVLREEYCWLWPDEDQPPSEAEYYGRVRKKEQAALCLSGGGIRSAAFALGVLQALSGKRILGGFHYLSTVSGGGYIGSFVQRWIAEHPRGATGVMEGLGSPLEPLEIKHLRENSNFITPRVGLGSNDTWTAVAMSLRNIIINWFLFFPLFLLLAVLPNWFLSGVVSVPTAVAEHNRFDDALLIFAGACVAASVFFTVPQLPSYREQSRQKGRIGGGSGDGWIFVRIVLPLLLWPTAGTLAISPELLDVGRVDKPTGLYELGGFALAAASFGGMLAGLVLGMAHVERGYFGTFFKDIVIWPVGFLVASLWVMLGAYLFDGMTAGGTDASHLSHWLTVAGPLWLLTGTLAGAVVFAAFRWAEGPKVKPDADREWLARVSGLKFKPMLAWAVAGASALLLLTLLRPWIDQNVTGPAILAFITGTGAALGGRSDNSGSHAAPARSGAMRWLPVSALVAIATFLFIVSLLVVMGGLEQQLAEWLARLLSERFLEWKVPTWIDALVIAHTALLLACAFLLVVIGWLIPVNRFSLNGLYRNRLARAFLGAARRDRDPNPFTGFDSADNVRLHLVRPDRPGSAAPRALYPVINCALNVTSTQNLAWQERKAEPFIFSPLYSGSGMLRERAGAYVTSTCYGGNEADLGLGADTSGVTLATAVSISGAAATPNMGYHSSPATAFLMTLFNVRLGAWLPNPALADKLGNLVTRSGPSHSLRAVLRELAGSTDDQGKDIYLSDGGHFENLAAYEMLRRRCRYILISDAGADPTCAFGDLGGLVRKAKIDLDIDISFGRMCIAARDADPKPERQLAWAMGEVAYPDGSKGTILYLKPSYFGDDLPVDIVSYANDSATFPHEPTGDQWFSESQFESYRHLGFHLAKRLAPGMAGTGIADFFDAASADYAEQLGRAGCDTDEPADARSRGSGGAGQTAPPGAPD